MAKYSDVKEEAIRIIDEFATQHEVEKHYGQPKFKPRYSASSKLASLGINMWVRRAMPKRVSSRMYQRFGTAWKGVGITQLETVETIGAFIVLMCLLTGTPVDPFPEPT